MPRLSNKLVSAMRRILVLLSVVSTLLVLSSLPSWGGEKRQDIHGDLVPPGTKQFGGYIYFIGATRPGTSSQVIRIDELFYTIDARTILRTKTGTITDITAFTPGMYVHYYAEGTLLTKMWESLPKEGPNSPTLSGTAAPESGNKTRKKETLHLDNGVWKN